MSAIATAHVALEDLARPAALGNYTGLVQILVAACGARVGAFFLAEHDETISLDGIDTEGQPSRRPPGSLEWAASAEGDELACDAPLYDTPRGRWGAWRIGPYQTIGGAVIAGAPASFSVGSDDVTGLIAHAGMVAISWHQLAEKQRHLEAEHRRLLTDSLTKVGSRLAIDEALKHVSRLRAHTSALFLIDLDGFKQVNDTQGHAAGDQVLVAVGRALLRAVRPEDFVGRLGGDEFVVIARSTAEEAPEVAKRIQSAIQKTGVGASVGWEHVAGDGEAALRAADKAMYRQKVARKTPGPFPSKQ